MAVFIDASSLNQGNIGDPTQNNRYIRYSIDFGLEPLDFQFPAGSQSLNTFGVPKCMFIDNQANNFELSILVGSTGQSFPVPANSAGIYYLDAVIGSNVVVTSAGDPPSAVTFVFYNFERSPVVWYKSSIVQAAVTVADGSDVAEGAKGDAAVTNPALSGSVIGILKGILTALNTGTGGAGNIVKQAVAANLNATVVGTGTFATQNTPVSNSYRNINTATTTVVKNAPGTLVGISINTGVAGTATIYDNTAGSGAVVAVVDTTTRGFVSFEGIAAATGITIVTSAAADVTVSYR